MGVCVSSTAAHGTHVSPESEQDKMLLRPSSPQDGSSTAQRFKQQEDRSTHGRGSKAAALPESVQAADSLPPSSRGRAQDSGSDAMRSALVSFEGMLTQLQQQMTNVVAENQALRSRVADLTAQQAHMAAQLHEQAGGGGGGGGGRHSIRDDNLDYGYGAKPDAAAGLALSTANAAAAHASQLESQMGDVQHRLSCLESNVMQVKDMFEGQRAAQEFAKQLQRVQESGMLPSRGGTAHGSKQSGSGVAAWMEPLNPATALLPAPVAFPKLKPARERRRLDAGGPGDAAGAAAGFASGPAPRPRGGGNAAGRRAGGPPIGAVSSPRTGAGITPAGFKSGPSQYPAAARPKPPGPSGLRPVDVLPAPSPPPTIGHPQEQYPTNQLPRTAPDLYSPVPPPASILGLPPRVDRVDSLIKDGRSPNWIGGGAGERVDSVNSPSWALDRSAGSKSKEKVDPPGWMGERAEWVGSKGVEKGQDSPTWMGSGGAGERAERVSSKAGNEWGAPSERVGSSPAGTASFVFRGGGASGPVGGAVPGVGASDWSETGAGGGLGLDRPSAPPERSAPSHNRLEVRPTSHQEWTRRPGGGGDFEAGGDGEEDLRGFGERVAASVLSTATHLTGGGDAEWSAAPGQRPSRAEAEGCAGGAAGFGDEPGRLSGVADRMRDSDPDIEMSGRFTDTVAKTEMMQMQRYDNVLPSDLLLAHHMRQGGGPRMGHLAAGNGPKQFL